MNTLFDGTIDGIAQEAYQLREELLRLPIPERIEALNRVREILSTASPFRDEPVDLVLWVPADRVGANDYNPNAVAPPEMKLLKISIDNSGFTQPVVTWVTDGRWEVVDGEHRCKVGKTIPRLRGYLPISIIRRDGRNERMAATIEHNRARGVHSILPMTDIVAEMLQNGWTDDEVARSLGMDSDELLRFKQNKGLPELFQNREYSRAWE